MTIIFYLYQLYNGTRGQKSWRKYSFLRTHQVCLHLNHRLSPLKIQRNHRPLHLDLPRHPWTQNTDQLQQSRVLSFPYCSHLQLAQKSRFDHSCQLYITWNEGRRSTFSQQANFRCSKGTWLQKIWSKGFPDINKALPSAMVNCKTLYMHQSQDNHHKNRWIGATYKQ